MPRALSMCLLCLVAVVQQACIGPLGPALGLSPAMDAVSSVVIIQPVAACAGLLVKKYTRVLRGRQSESTRLLEARKTLAERYAHGEIGRREYLEKIEDIQRTSS
jgi:uncharacterized membrane protein